MIEEVVTALLSGVAAAATKIASKSVEETYGALKQVVTEKLGVQSDAVHAIMSLEAKPDSEGRKATVVEEFKALTVADHPDLLYAARELQTALDHLPAEDRAHIQHAIGSYIAQASGGSTATVNVDSKGTPPNQ